MIIRLIHAILNSIDISINRLSSINNDKLYLRRIISTYESLIIERQRIHELKDNSITGIVFSMDRAMQLHLLLKSYFSNAANPAPLYVLYKTNSGRHRKSYEEVELLFKDRGITFIAEHDFRRQLIKLISNLNASKLFFLTDDGVFIDKFDIKVFSSVDDQNFIFSLTRGENLNFSFTFDIFQELPEFTKLHGHRDLLTWSWENRPDSPSWNYPISVDGCCYNKREIEILISNIEFKNPNSLEKNLQIFKNIFMKRSGVCYRNAVFVNIHCNRVQTEYENLINNHHTVEELLEKWEAGFQIRASNFGTKDIRSIQTSRFIFEKRM